MERTTKPIWTKEWPKREGIYWFYGWDYRPTRERIKPKLLLVEVHETSQKGKFVYTTQGNFLYAAEGAKGMWREAELPKLPKLVHYEEEVPC